MKPIWPDEYPSPGLLRREVDSMAEAITESRAFSLLAVTAHLPAGRNFSRRRRSRPSTCEDVPADSSFQRLGKGNRP